MKRSEIIIKLIKEIELMRGVVDGYYVYPEDEQIANRLLTKLEKIGMLPPKTDWLVNNFPDKMTWEQVNDYHMWEPENE